MFDYYGNSPIRFDSSFTVSHRNLMIFRMNQMNDKWTRYWYSNIKFNLLVSAFRRLTNSMYTHTLVESSTFQEKGCGFMGSKGHSPICPHGSYITVLQCLTHASPRIPTTQCTNSKVVETLRAFIGQK